MKRLNIPGAQATAMALPVCLLQSPWKNKESRTAVHLDSGCVVGVSKQCCTWAFAALPAPDGLGFWAAGRNESGYVKQGPGLDSAACDTLAAMSTLLHSPCSRKLPQIYYLRGVASACAKRLRPEFQQIAWWGCELAACSCGLYAHPSATCVRLQCHSTATAMPPCVGLLLPSPAA